MRLSDSFAAARVSGDSLIDDGIFDGDYLICLLTHEAPDGALVVALTPEGLTVKYLSRQPDGTVLLHSTNPDYPNQIWNGEDVLVQGIVKRIRRDLWFVGTTVFRVGQTKWTGCTGFSGVRDLLAGARAAQLSTSSCQSCASCESCLFCLHYPPYFR